MAKENKKYRKSNLDLTNMKDKYAKEKVEAIKEKDVTKQGVNALTREIEYLRKETENEKTNILNLIRDRDMMQKYIKKAEDENQKN